MRASEQMSNDSSIIFSGSIASDRAHSLKLYDQQVINALRKSGIGLNALREHLPLRERSNRIVKLVCKQLIYPALVKKSTADAVFMHIGSQDYAYLGKYARCPVTITCHDLAEFHHTRQSDAQYRLWKSRMEWLPNADHIFCISEYTLNDVVKYFGVERSRVSVNYNGFCPLNKVLPAELSSTAQGLLREKKKRFFIFHPGVTQWRKNIPVLLEALHILQRRKIDVCLVKAGDCIHGSHAGLIEQLELKDSVFDFGRVSLKELNDLYSICDVLAFPSIYEGFGLPILEAQSCGLPCVIADSTALPEVGGHGALYHDPMNASELADHLQLIFEDEVLKADMVRLGYENIKRFSWEKHARKILDWADSIDL
jgi:glycosyltransferase involved in cell wall biosynthesis